MKNKGRRRINETCIERKIGEDTYVLKSVKIKSTGKHWGHWGYEGVVELWKNGKRIEIQTRFVWSQIKHLTPNVLRYFKTKIKDV